MTDAADICRRGNMRIEGKRVLITGASSGIGLALAKIHARKGAILMLTSRRERVLQEIARGIKTEYPQSATPLAIQCDVSNRGSVDNLIENCADRLGGIDILINNAGISVYGSTEKTTMEDFLAVMEVNYFGALYCALRAIPLMKHQGSGLIVNIASVVAKHGVPYLGAYSASKAALVAVSKSLRSELSRDGIRIMNVFPGYTRTNIFENEKKVGGAVRPQNGYAPVSKVAEAIVAGIEHEKQDLILSYSGKALPVLRRLLPSFVELVMERMAVKLRDTKEVSHE
jgi:short-subunit dehydrogenase